MQLRSKKNYSMSLCVQHNDIDCPRQPFVVSFCHLLPTIFLNTRKHVKMYKLDIYWCIICRRTTHENLLCFVLSLLQVWSWKPIFKKNNETIKLTTTLTYFMVLGLYGLWHSIKVKNKQGTSIKTIASKKIINLNWIFPEKLHIKTFMKAGLNAGC